MFWNLFKAKPDVKMSSDPRHLLGAAGEAEAARYLEKQGYKIVTRNFRGRFGEIDIIAKDRDVLVFVEVKTRSQGSLGTPEEAVTPRKIARITKAAAEYMAANERATSDVNVRFDVVGVTSEAGSIKCTLIKDAFPFEG